MTTSFDPTRGASRASWSLAIVKSSWSGPALTTFPRPLVVSPRVELPDRLTVGGRSIFMVASRIVPSSTDNVQDYVYWIFDYLALVSERRPSDYVLCTSHIAWGDLTLGFASTPVEVGNHIIHPGRRLNVGQIDRLTPLLGKGLT